MTQPVLADLFVVPVAEIPAVPDVPIAPSASPIMKHCQKEGREKAGLTKQLLWIVMREFYLARWAQFDGWTDEEMAAKLSLRFGRKIERTTVNARRNEMNGIGECGKRKNPHSGVNNTVWGVKR